MRALTAIALFARPLCGPGAGAAPDDADRARDAEIEVATSRLTVLAQDLREDRVDDPVAFERGLRWIIKEARGRTGPVRDLLGRSDDSLSLLGPAPKEGAPPEAAAIAAEREALNTRISYLRGQQTRILANIDTGAALLGELSGRRLRDLYRNVVRRDAPLALPTIWRDAAAEAQSVSAALQRHLGKWTASRADAGGVFLNVAGLAAAIAVSLLMFGPIRDWARRAFTSRLEAHQPTPARRVAAAGVKMLTRLVPGLIGGVIIIETSRALGLLGPEGVPVARALWIALVAYLLVDGFVSGLFAPSAPAWRIADIDTAKGRRVSALLLAIVIVVGAKSVLTEIARVAGDAGRLVDVIAGIAALGVGGLLFALCESQLWTTANAGAETAAAQKTATGRGDGPWPGLRLAGRALSVLIIAAALAGHINLADFVSTRLYYLALLIGMAWFARAALKESAAWADRRLKSGRAGAAADGDAQAFQFWIGAGIDLVLLIAVAPALFVLAGVDASAVRDIFLRAFVGFRVGGVVISLSDIFLAVGVFVGILTATRVLQGALQRGPLAHSRMDSGIRNSLTTLFGYAGLVVAAVVGLGMLGVDLSNLALIAGALSVGIGFGLQSIVNNFVSGLILLFERPIKAGDWIVTASGEGIVKKISVRSTELETFDRASIIIPNSELIASTVTNWTHKSALGRIRVPVGVSYDSDPDLVREILLTCANDHPLVVRYPEPFVVWEAFGASSLDFELRAFISDIAKGLQVRTDLRYAIFRAFQAGGVEIPFPRQDVHIRSAASPAPARRGAGVRAGEAPRHEPEDAEAPDD